MASPPVIVNHSVVRAGTSARATAAGLAAYAGTRRGVVIENMSGVYVDATSFIESGAVLSHDVTVSGKSLIKGGARIRPYTLIEDSTVSSFAEVGPFVHLRPDTCVGSYCRIDSFTELKNAALGDGTKAASLSYIGDADVGENATSAAAPFSSIATAIKKAVLKSARGAPSAAASSSHPSPYGTTAVSPQAPSSPKK